MLKDIIEKIRQENLLDLTRRNPLINFKKNKSDIYIIDEIIPFIYQRLVKEEKEFIFIPIPDQPDESYLIDNSEEIKRLELKKQKIENLANSTTFESERDTAQTMVNNLEKKIHDNMNENTDTYLSKQEIAKSHHINTNSELPDLSIDDASEKHLNKYLQTYHTSDELEKILSKLTTNHKRYMEESGISGLHLVLGFLSWKDGSQENNSPLISIPITLDKNKKDSKIESSKCIKWRNTEDIVDNLSLAEKIRRDYDLELPFFEKDDDIDSYFEKIENFIEINPQFSIKKEVAIKILHFSKVLMYKDLDTENWDDELLEHKVINSILVNQDVIQKDYSLDNIDIDQDEKYNDIPLITDADSSQHKAIVKAINGENMVIEGPPGTGKSQTITNLIAALLNEGKKILFVSEKDTALNVVFERLKKANLGDFCLELHSNKTKTEQIKESLKSRLELNNTKINKTLYKTNNQIKKKRRQYADELSEIINDETFFNILWGYNLYKEEYEQYPTSDIDFSSINFENIEKPILDYENYLNNNKINFLWCLFDVNNVNSLNQDDVKQKIKNIIDIVNLIKSSEDFLAYYGIETFMLSDIENQEVKMENLKKLSKNVFENIHSSISYERFKDILNNKEHFFRKLHLNNHLENQIIKTDIVLSKIDDFKDSIDLTHNENGLTHLKDEDIAILNQFLLINDEEIAHRKQELDTIIKPDNYHKPKEFAVKHNALVNDKIVDIDTECEALKQLINTFKEQKKYLIENITHNGLNLLEFNYEEFKNDIQIINYFDKRHNMSYLNVNLLKDDAEKRINEYKELISDNELFRHQEMLDVYFKTNLDDLNEKELFGIKEILINNTDSVLKRMKKEYKNALKQINNIYYLQNQTIQKVVDDLEKTITYKKEKDKINYLYRDLITGFHNIEDIENLIILSKRIRDSLKDKELFRTIVLQNNLDEYNVLIEISDNFSHWLQNNYLNSTIDIDLLKGVEESLVKDERKYSEFLDDLKHIIINKNFSLSDIIKKISDLENLETQYEQFKVKLSEFNKFHDLYITESHLNNIYNNDYDFYYILDTVRQYKNLKKNIQESQEQLKELEIFEITNLEWDDFLKMEDGFSHTPDVDIAFLMSKPNFDFLIEYFGKIRKHELYNYLYLKEDYSLQDMENLLSKSFAEFNTIFSYKDYLSYKNTLIEENLASILEFKLDECHNLIDYIKYNYYKYNIEKNYNHKYKLFRYKGHEHNKDLQEYIDTDNKIFKENQNKLINKLLKNDTYWEYGHNGKISEKTEGSLIEHITGSSKNTRIKIRDLINRAGYTLQAIKPCFLMSPLSVAKYISMDGNMQFDVLIVDEASQLKIEDALGSILRSQQTIVVGDSKQLPPSTTFSGSNEDEEDIEHDYQESESILDLMSKVYKPTYQLKWHYRSKHQNLIAFSNKYFYNDSLVVYPSPIIDNLSNLGVHYRKVPNGVYEKNINKIEAEEIVKEVINNMINFPDKSILVATFNKKQQDYIMDLMETERLNNNKVKAYFNKHENIEPFDVKNLENIQGQERDFVFISTLYGKDSNGSFYNRFGGGNASINGKYGWRRLNVLISRAKEKMHIFSSLESKDIKNTDNKNRGIQDFKKFIEFLENGCNFSLSDIPNEEINFDSPFEEAVYNVIKDFNFNINVVTQANSSGYFVDLAIKIKNTQHYILGIECDGATFHNSKYARERDKIRQMHLENLGWNIHRIWSTDWFEDKSREVELLKNKISESIEEYEEKTVKNFDIDKNIEKDSENLLFDMDEKIQKDLEDLRDNKILKYFDMNSKNILTDERMTYFIYKKPINHEEFLESSIEIRDIDPKQVQFLGVIFEIIERNS